MPSGTTAFVEPFIKWLHQHKPKSVLDVGCGTGRFGYLAREFLDFRHGRFDRYVWLTKIDAVEIWSTYIHQFHREIYDDIHLGDFRDSTFRANCLRPGYDLVMLFDVVEHFEKDEAKSVIQDARIYGKWTLLSTPKGFSSQGHVLGNPHEEHLSGWTADELTHLGAQSVEEKDFSLWAAFPQKRK